jgi:hypothetical protein
MEVNNLTLIKTVFTSISYISMYSFDAPKKPHPRQPESRGWPTNPRNYDKCLGLWIWPHFEISSKYYTVNDSFGDPE